MNNELYGTLSETTRYYQIKEGFNITREKNNKEIVKYKMWIDDGATYGMPLVAWLITAIGLWIVISVWTDGSNYTVGATIFIIGLIIGLVLLSVITTIKWIKALIEFPKQRKFYKSEIEALESENAMIPAKAIEFEKEYGYIENALPVSYRNLQASAYMLLAVVNGRADTMKEAVNLYEEQLHRWKLEDAARQTAEAQEYMAQAVQELNARQAETNQRLRNIEYMEYQNYIKHW